MNEYIENTNVSNPEIKTKRFNLKSLILVINYFITPILFFIVVAALFRFTLIDDLIFDSEIAKRFFENNPSLIENDETFNNFLSSILGSLATIFTFVMALLIYKNRKDSISIKKTEFSIAKLILFGVALGIIMLSWNFVISYVYSIIGLDFKSGNTEGIAESLKYNKLLIFNLLVAAPIGEEIAFKYGIFTFLHEIFQKNGKFLKILLPAFVSAFIFGMIHDGLYLVPLYFVPSFIGCLIYEKTKSLMPCILGHFINNIVALIAMLYS
ncbi:CPBP family intramembrane glutamic endopeptidase [Parvimonas sp. G1425]|uniref:CPBP family intramembrane glutamic endopeptidase n=1 Tax=Parvimonas sp. G1425 TaxID=3387694 RepID=UPI0039E623AD